MPARDGLGDSLMSSLERERELRVIGHAARIGIDRVVTATESQSRLRERWIAVEQVLDAEHDRRVFETAVLRLSVPDTVVAHATIAVAGARSRVDGQLVALAVAE